MKSPVGRASELLAAFTLISFPAHAAADPPAPSTAPKTAAIAAPKTDPKTAALVAAIQANSVAKVAAALAKGAEINARDANGSTPLMQACAASGIEIITLLLNKGGDIAAKDKDGFTPLMVAAYGGKAAVAQLLLDKGAEVNIADTRGRTPLMGAAYSGRDTVVKLLLDKAANIGAKDSEDFTPLMVAAGAGNTESVRLLLEKGADIHAPTKTGFTPLMQACGAGSPAIVKLLLEKGARVNDTAVKGSTALLVASYGPKDTEAMPRYAEVIKSLLDRGAQANAEDAVGHTPLIGCAYSGNVEGTALLLNRGAKVETRTKTGFTALMQAAYSGRVEVAKRLLDKGAEVEVATNQGITPLMQAAGTGNEPMVRLLLRFGADVNAQDVKKQTAAAWSVKRAHEELLPLLAQAGTALDGLTDRENKPLAAAAVKPLTAPLPVSERVAAIIGSAPQAPAAPSLNGAAVVGVSPNRPFLYRLPAVGKGTLVFGASPLPAGLTLDKTTGILSGRIAAPGTYKVTVTAANVSGKATRLLTVVCGPGKAALTPPMGWSCWSLYGENVTGALLRKQADWLVKTGLAAHGYQYILLDDTWQGRRDTTSGELDSNRRIGDVGALADYLHAKGLKMGLYSSPNEESCAGYAGSLGHEEQDARQFAKWGVDYLKYDWCDAQSRRGQVTEKMLTDAFSKMRAALDKTDRDMVYAVTPYGFGNAAEWGKQVGANSWWTNSQILETWESVSRNGFGTANWTENVGPGHWNDPGWLLLGKVGSAILNPHFTKLTAEEQKAQFSLWSLAAAPLILSCDLTQLDPNTFFPVTTAILTNDEVIAVDQDALGKPAESVRDADHGTTTGNNEVWVRPLADGTVAVGLFNRQSYPKPVTVAWADLKLTGPQNVRDLWQRKDLGQIAEKYIVTVPPHGVVLLKVGK